MSYNRNRLMRVLTCVLVMVIVVTSIQMTPIQVNASTKNQVKNTYTGAGYQVTFEVTNQWKTTFKAKVTIKNTGDTVINSWALGFKMPYEITKIWNGIIESNDYDKYLIENTGTKKDIAVGKSVSFGFIAKHNGKIVVPSTYHIPTIETIVDSQNYKVSFKITGDGKKAVTGEIKITNLSKETIKDWKLEFDSEYQITKFKSAEIMNHNGSHYFIKNVEYNANIKPGKNIVIRFNAKPGKTKKNPNNYILRQVTSVPILTTPTPGPTSIPAPTSKPSTVLTPEPDLDIDTDLDGLTDYIESLLGTNKELADTDGDGLTDGHEYYIYGLNPLKFDSDGDGINDGNEDNDSDGLSNLDEITKKTNPLIPDTDYDGLSDGEEVNIYHTDPLIPDTDEDGMSDGDEVALGLNPLSKDSDGNGILDIEEKIEQTLVNEITEVERPEVKSVALTMKGTGYINNTTRIENTYNIDTLSSDVVGLIGVPIDITSDSDFDEATITFSYDETLLGDTKEEDLRVMWYDEENDQYVIMDNETVLNIEKNTISYTTTHFSTYLVVDRKEWYRAWSDAITYHRQPINNSIPTEYFDFCFVLDCSSSMKGKNAMTSKEIISKFIDAMYTFDRGAIIGFNSSTNTHQLFTPSKNSLKSSLISITNNGNNKGDWLTAALMLFESTPDQINNNKTNSKMIILITDGAVHSKKESLDIAKEKGIKINTVLIGSTYKKNNFKEISEKTGGKLYIADNAEEIRKSIFGVKEENIGSVDLKDTDGDRLPDIYETAGMIISNGQYMFSDPQKIDTDDDGITDAEEMGVKCNYGEQPKLKQLELDDLEFDSKIYAEYFEYISDPNEADSDGDGCSDISDIFPRNKTMQDFLNSEIYYVGYNNKVLKINGTSIKVSNKQESKDEMFRFVWCGEGYKITPLNWEIDNKVLTLSIDATGEPYISLKEDKSLKGQIWEISYYYDYINNEIFYHNGLVIRNKMLDKKSIGRENTSYYLSVSNGVLGITKDRFNKTNIEIYSISKNWMRFGMMVLKYGNFIGKSNKDVKRAISSYFDNVKVGLDNTDNLEYYTPTGDNLVLGQNIGNFTNLKYGDTTMEAAGCGLIASYNAMTLADYEVDFFRLAAEFEFNGLTSTFFLDDGKFGSSPIKINDCFNAYNVKFKSYSEISKMDTDLLRGKSGMLLIGYVDTDATGKNIYDLIYNTFKDAYAHYFTVTYDSTNPANPITFINYSCENSTFSIDTSIKSALTKGKEYFLSGYILN